MVHSTSRSRWRRLAACALPAALLVATMTTNAQQPSTQTARPDPLDPKASVPALTYESAFAQYRRLGEEKAVSWREANDNVARIGGWRVYAREAQQPDPAPAAAPATKPAAGPAPASNPPPAPMPAGHGGHKTP
jgi:hypothetical protein